MHKTTHAPTYGVSRAFKLLLCGMLLFASSSKAQTVTPWMTTGDQTKLLQQQSTVSFGTNSGTNPSTVTVNAGTTYQTMDGFGYTLTEGSCEVISGMAATQQNQLLNDLYNPTTGLNASVVRISIGASDLSSSSYSYNETSGDTNMNNFSLNGPDLTYLIPIIKKIQLINPNIKILATPWSAPRWMKTNGSWVGGSLQTQYYAAYAKYFVKYFDAMKAQGINIWGITPQNEPENPNNEPSMLMNSTEQKNFINQQLGPQMAAAGYGNIKIIAFDHNCDNTAYPIDVLNNSSYVDGAAFHLYLGNISAMSTVKTQTNKNVYFTEQYTGSGGSFGGDFGWHMQNVVIGSTTNWSKTVLEWNAANNPSLGPRTPGGCTTCLGAVTVNNSTSYTKNVAYYIIGQISKFVKPGAVRISSSSSSGSIVSVGFKNPDGSIALLVYNTSGSSNTIKVVSGSSAFNYAIPGSSAVTFNWGA
ncbi:O-glycosyl hydrolase [Flavobacterium nitrogenifigens]|uniref:O-glycosyl hydrolase n=2 Tax=Flavobacterium TaxID=237 RepID=A0A7W7J2P1_9FLAO|nr:MULTISPECIES: glycoside hydrolase family 30 beta sandwich domain-containing protein [Flavobacterium]MBB4804480.1 O-glycosyl hydrolase [Flavobacterium nitrogenifigens]MBB6389392.1 O-glycosyl hydrolase [Flavobacterium notoginsengisoli]